MNNFFHIHNKTGSTAQISQNLHFHDFSEDQVPSAAAFLAQKKSPVPFLFFLSCKWKAMNSTPRWGPPLKLQSVGKLNAQVNPKEMAKWSYIHTSKSMSMLPLGMKTCGCLDGSEGPEAEHGGGRGRRTLKAINR